MSDYAPVLKSELDLDLLHRGKVRDVYAIDDETLLMVASDRVSAFDVVLPQPIPFKGEVLTLVTAWWLEQLESRVAHHLIAVDPDRIIARLPGPPYKFLDRITDIRDCRQWELKPGGTIEACYDVPPDAWYFRADRQPVMPVATILWPPENPP